MWLKFKESAMVLIQSRALLNAKTDPPTTGMPIVHQGCGIIREISRLIYLNHILVNWS